MSDSVQTIVAIAGLASLVVIALLLGLISVRMRSGVENLESAIQLAVTEMQTARALQQARFDRTRKACLRVVSGDQGFLRHIEGDPRPSISWGDDEDHQLVLTLRNEGNYPAYDVRLRVGLLLVNLKDTMNIKPGEVASFVLEDGPRQHDKHPKNVEDFFEWFAQLNGDDRDSGREKGTNADEVGEYPWEAHIYFRDGLGPDELILHLRSEWDKGDWGGFYLLVDKTTSSALCSGR